MPLFPISQNMSVFLMGPQEEQRVQSCQSLPSAEQFQRELSSELPLLCISLSTTCLQTHSFLKILIDLLLKGGKNLKFSFCEEFQVRIPMSAPPALDSCMYCVE